MTKVTAIRLAVVMLALTGALAPAGAQDADSKAVPGGNAASPATYSSHSYPRQGDQALEAWARANYADYFIEESLEFLQIGGKQAISFRSQSESNNLESEFNILLDTGDALVLLTSARFRGSMDVSRPDDLRIGEEESIAASCNTTTNSCNCVFYARCRVPSLPFGLNTYENKVAIINTYVPKVGAIAIMRVGLPAGHLGVVTKVTKNSQGTVTSITIDEANYQACKFGTRSGSPSTLKVTGYFKP